MLVVHTGDLHLGIANYAPINPTTGLSMRIEDFFNAFDKAVEYAIDNKADLFLLCGDTFKDPTPNPTILKMFASRLSRLAEAQIKTVIIAGNHDAAKEGRAAPPEPFIELKVPNVSFFAKPDFVDLECRSGEKARVFAIPYRHPVKLASDKKKGKTELQRDVLVQTFREQVAKEIEIFSRAGKKDADAGILVGHLSIEGAIAGSERIWQTGEEFSILPSILDSETFDYIALGHVHKHQSIKFKTPIVYCGSIERVDLSEADENKGFISVEVKNGTAQWKFIKVPGRPMHDIHVDCRNTQNPVAEVKAAIGENMVKDSILRLQIVIEDALTQTQRDEIASLTKEAFWQQLLYQKLAREKKATTGAFAGTLEPSQALTKYLKGIKINDDDRTLALKLGQQIIDETLAEVES
jgi:exonuclease SbcD